MKNCNKIKNAFKDVNVSKKLERKILNMTVNKEKEAYKKIKLAYLTTIVLLIGCISLSIVYANEIKGFIENWKFKIGLGDEEGTSVELIEHFGFKQIPDGILENELFTHPEDGDIAEEPPQITFKEVEDMLGFNILNPYDKLNDAVSYNTHSDEEGNIKRVFIDSSIVEWTEENPKRWLSFHATILTQNATEEEFLASEEGIMVSADKVVEDSYHSTNLDTDIMFFSYDWSETRFTVIFAYDDILYQFNGEGVSREEIIEIIENLK